MSCTSPCSWPPLRASIACQEQVPHIGKLQSIRPRARRIRYPVGSAPGPTPRCSAAARCTRRARGSAARPRTAVRTGPADSCLSRAPLGARHCSHAATIQRAGARHTLPDRYTNRRHATACPTPSAHDIEYTPGHQLATQRKACALTRAAAAVSTPRRGRHLRSTRGIAAALRRASAASRTGSARCGAARTCFATECTATTAPVRPGSLLVNPAGISLSQSGTPIVGMLLTRHGVTHLSRLFSSIACSSSPTSSSGRAGCKSFTATLAGTCHPTPPCRHHHRHAAIIT
eukprot:COSAG01_NODE_524_length_15931_cov_72.340491_14_plen_288_part_00